MRNRWGFAVLVLAPLLIGAAGKCRLNVVQTPGLNTPISRADSTPAGSRTPPVECRSSAPVPPEQAGIYNVQRDWLSGYRAVVDLYAPGDASQTTFGGHLLTADSNRGPALLGPDSLLLAERALDRFQELGMRGVTLNLGYPMLMPWFPDSEKYLAYYKHIAASIHRRGMSLAIEQIVLYTGSQFSPFTFNFDGLTLGKYTDDQAQMAQIVIDELAPDYLTILHEPDTVAQVTGLTEILVPDVATAHVNAVLGKLRRGKTLVGAGSGSWSGPLYADSFSNETDVDYIEIHIYWINTAAVLTAYDMARRAGERGKPVVLTEVGLYKSAGEGLEGTPELNGVAAVYRRDVFSFWEPLDIKFMETTAAFARSVEARYVSVYWTNMFFAYVDWTPETKGMSWGELNGGLAGRKAAEAWVAGRITCAGRAYESIIGHAS